MIALGTYAHAYNLHRNMDKVVEQMANLIRLGGEAESAAKTIFHYMPRGDEYRKNVFDLINEQKQGIIF